MACEDKRAEGCTLGQGRERNETQVGRGGGDARVSTGSVAATECEPAGTAMARIGR